MASDQVCSFMSRDWFAKLLTPGEGHGSWSWRTFEHSFLEPSGWQPFSASFPRAGCFDPSNGTAFRRQPSAPLTGVTGCSSWPTPSAVQGHNSGRMDEWGGSNNPLRGTALGQSPVNPMWVEKLMGFPAGYTEVV